MENKQLTNEEIIQAEYAKLKAEAYKELEERVDVTIRKTLQKQLELLSERSTTCENFELIGITNAMCEVCKTALVVVNTTYAN